MSVDIWSMTSLTAIAFGATAGLLIPFLGLRALRRVGNRQLVWVAVSTAGLAAGTFVTSFLKVSAWAGTPWPGLFLDASIVVFMTDQLILEPRGKRVPAMSWAQWILLGVTVLANGQGEPDLAHAAIHSCQPVVLKIAVMGLKALVLDDAGFEVTDRVPARRWVRDPVGSWWISRQLALGRVGSYREAVGLDNRVAAEAIRLRVERSGSGWRRAPSGRDLVLLEALGSTEPKRRGQSNGSSGGSVRVGSNGNGHGSNPVATLPPAGSVDGAGVWAGAAERYIAAHGVSEQGAGTARAVAAELDSCVEGRVNKTEIAGRVGVSGTLVSRYMDRLHPFLPVPEGANLPTD